MFGKDRKKRKNKDKEEGEKTKKKKERKTNGVGREYEDGRLVGRERKVGEQGGECEMKI